MIGQNRYLCDNCKTKTNSSKKFTFTKLPNIMIVQLKRFDNFMRKVKNFVRYPRELDISKISDKIGLDHGKNDIFELYSVLIHEGFSLNSGHYFSYIKHKNKNWYEANDSFVSKIDERTVMSQKPYILFYCRKNYEDRKFSLNKENFTNQNLANNLNKLSNSKFVNDVNEGKIKVDEKEKEIQIIKDKQNKISLEEDNNYNKDEKKKVDKFIDLRKVHNQKTNCLNSNNDKEKKSDVSSTVNLNVIANTNLIKSEISSNKDNSNLKSDEKKHCHIKKSIVEQNCDLILNSDENSSNGVFYDFFKDLTLEHPYTKSKLNRLKLQRLRSKFYEDFFEECKDNATQNSSLKSNFEADKNENYEHNKSELKCSKNHLNEIIDEKVEDLENNTLKPRFNKKDFLNNNITTNLSSKEKDLDMKTNKNKSGVNNYDDKHIKNKSVESSLFNGKRTNTWSDSEDENDENYQSKTSNSKEDIQMKFIESNEVFNKSKPNVKSSYDIKYDEGKCKKVKLKSNKDKDRNQFQRFQKKFSLKYNN